MFFFPVFVFNFIWFSLLLFWTLFWFSFISSGCSHGDRGRRLSHATGAWVQHLYSMYISYIFYHRYWPVQCLWLCWGIAFLMKMLYNQILCVKSFAVNYLFIPTWSVSSAVTIYRLMGIYFIHCFINQFLTLSFVLFVVIGKETEYQISTVYKLSCDSNLQTVFTGGLKYKLHRFFQDNSLNEVSSPWPCTARQVCNTPPPRSPPTHSRTIASSTTLATSILKRNVNIILSPTRLKLADLPSLISKYR